MYYIKRDFNLKIKYKKIVYYIIIKFVFRKNLEKFIIINIE